MKTLVLLGCLAGFGILAGLWIETNTSRRQNTEPVLAGIRKTNAPVKDLTPVLYGALEFRPGALWLDDKGVPINAHDGGMLYHDGVYYWFGSHRIAGPAEQGAQVGIHVYSSTDLYSWNDGGIALAVSPDPLSEIVRGCMLERPKVIFNAKTGKFVMWLHLEYKGQDFESARSAVAVADQATGPYRYLYSLRPNAGIWPEDLPQVERHPLSPQELAQFEHNGYSTVAPENEPVIDFPLRRDFQGGQMARDMTVFVDDDQTAYHIYCSEENQTLHISRLTDDYLKPAGSYVRIRVGDLNEAPAMFKHDGMYFLITSGTTGWKPNPASLYSAESIIGPWKYRGNPCDGAVEQRKTTFESQGTYVLPVAGKEDAYIFMADRWRPDNAIDSRYVWLPIRWDSGTPFLRWAERWNLGVFDKPPSSQTIPSRP